ncbi:VaFE repeat-containing surface-anchored protein [Paramicrobacterium sp. CJ85]|uniref:VaFE repeat-containing surface-anchored protein n=1 Tax=Paramicrobacterium sp. CJ85 TaxID=3445355 RepID=UPI003F5E49E2
MKQHRGWRMLAAGTVAAATAAALSFTAAAPAFADGTNGEVRGYLWPGGNGVPNWEGTYRMPDGTEAWCASVWEPEPIYADSYGDPVPLTKEDGTALSSSDMSTLAYVISTASHMVINKSGKTADSYAAAASVIIHDKTNGAPNEYKPEWPLGHFDNGDDPLGTGQQTDAVHGIYDSLLADASKYAGPWTIALDGIDTVTLGDTVTITGSLTSGTGAGVPNRDVTFDSTGIDLVSTTVPTNADGVFTVEGIVTAEVASATVSRIAPADTVMMREPVSWDSNSARPQNMILIDDSAVSDTVNLTVEAAPAPSIGTSATDQSDGDKIIAWDGGTVVDAVSYENLTPGEEYTLTGELVNKETGEKTGITGETTFTPTEANGTVDVTFTVPEGFDGTTLVAYEKLLDSEGTVIATHEDINDDAQTVTVEDKPAPSIGTSATDQSDGDKIIAWDGGTVVDAVSYENLTPGEEYTLTGELVNKETGEKTGITGETTFTPTEANGTVDVTFTVPEGFDGTTLVAYEKLLDSEGTVIATHEDINDDAQTVTVEDKPNAPAPSADGDEPTATGITAHTGGTPVDGASTGIWVSLILLGAALSFGTAAYARRRQNQ